MFVGWFVVVVFFVFNIRGLGGGVVEYPILGVMNSRVAAENNHAFMLFPF